MSKAFTRENDHEEDEPGEGETVLPRGTRNYMTPAGSQRLKSELKRLVETERPEVTRTVSWAASNGDRSENGDYIYGKRRLREIDRRIRYLMKRLEAAEVVDPRDRSGWSRYTVRAGWRSATRRQLSIPCLPAGSRRDWPRVNERRRLYPGSCPATIPRCDNLRAKFSMITWPI